MTDGWRVLDPIQRVSNLGGWEVEYRYFRNQGSWAYLAGSGANVDGERSRLQAIANGISGGYLIEANRPSPPAWGFWVIAPNRRIMGWPGAAGGADHWVNVVPAAHRQAQVPANTGVPSWSSLHTAFPDVMISPAFQLIGVRRA